MAGEQLSLFGYDKDHAATWSPRDLWLKLDGLNLSGFLEDRRLERKSASSIHFDALAEYMSMWSNTVDGGILLIGVEDDGRVTGCARLSQDKLNRIEAFHTQMCPEASPESRRIATPVNGKPDFVLSIFVPYRGVLVETSKGEAFIRRGDTKHRMSPEEKDDFRSTRHERSWEQRASGMFNYPTDFDTSVIRELCDNFRERESKDWTDEEVILDRHLVVEQGDTLVPLNCLVLFAAKDPRFQHPGCRIRVQRFDGTEEGSGQSFAPIRDFYIEGNIPTILERAGEKSRT